MSSSRIAVRMSGVSKCYPIFSTPRDRLKQFVLPRLQRWAGQAPAHYFREFWALRDVSFELRQGEAIGIIGRNGSGKSTLLQILCGTLRPTTGQVEVNGRVAALLELGAGFNPEFSGRENVYLNAALLGLTREQIDARFDSIAAFADIGEFLEQPVKLYSSGMFVRLAFAVIAHVDADILVIDEALAVGDALFTQKCIRFIRKFREHGSLIYVSHDSGSVMGLCDRALWLQRGEVRGLGNAKEVCEGYLDDLFRSLDTQAVSEPVVENTGGERVQIQRLAEPGLVWRDQRSDMVNASNLRNDIEVFRFDDNDEKAYGGDDATIDRVMLLDSQRNPLSWVVGGEKTIIRIEAHARIALNRPIFGFMLRDRLGQNIFGDNSYISFSEKHLAVEAGGRLVAEFEFFMPWLAQGDYVVQVALADGTQQEHRQLHWIHDAVVLRAHHEAIATGLIGIPMVDIRLSVENASQAAVL